MADGGSPLSGVFSHFHVKTHPEKLTVPIGGSVSVLGSNKYLCTGRLAQSADVGVMNGPVWTRANESLPVLHAVDTAGG